ncbi:HPF/RaiA family ribosome-associated protein [Flavobacterium sp.]|uniref:HPF/RaiA family ribosome-associated protein n=1 Tax=Flavobacterium sp. TaxID=239 RepID=UPI0024877E22|nr:HPF/RaiA family ribosome-associated protein [Flavobacterium sp.]MDI1317390.1 HPF/RaiA family ribosome-associated protein [Flavobacterium sp.]
MKIQFNTDKTISGEERNQNHFTSVIEESLKRFENHITRIEVHLSDENGKKDGINDTVCLLEARLEGRKPIAVSCKADSEIVALTGATTKLKASLTTILGRIQDQEKENTRMQ